MPAIADQNTQLALTFGAFSIAILLLVYSYLINSNILVAALAGCVGGIAHEFAQSGGTIAFYKVKEDGAYLGSLSGIPIGAISGLLFYFANSNQILPIVASQSLLAGLGFKAVAEAAGGNEAPQPQDELTIEDVAINVTNNSVRITVRNIGDYSINISRIYVGDYAWTSPDGLVSPQNFRDFAVNDIVPRLVAGKLYPIKVVTSRATIQSQSVES